MSEEVVNIKLSRLDSAFRQHYRLSEQEYGELWDKATGSS